MPRLLTSAATVRSSSFANGDAITTFDASNGAANCYFTRAVSWGNGDVVTGNNFGDTRILDVATIRI